MSEYFLDVVEQFRVRLQFRPKAPREIRGTVGSGKAETLGELAQSRLGVTVARPGCDRPRPGGVAIPCKQGRLDIVEIVHGSEDSFRV
jgi:hypothetical protein